MTALAGCGKSSQPQPNVLWIVNDSSRAMNYSCYGYNRETSPNVDVLAKSGTLFEQAYSQAFFTGPSVSSFLTSRYFPFGLATHLASDFIGSVDIQESPKDEVLAPTVFAKNGYKTLIISGNPAYLAKKSRAYQAFQDGYIPRADDMGVIGGPRYKCTFRTIIPILKRWIGRTQKQKQPFFAYIHSMDSHSPFVFPPQEPFNQWKMRDYSGKWIGEFEPNFSYKTAQKVEPEDIEQLAGLYDGAIHYGDHHLNKLFDHMDSEGLMKNTIIIYTSDHGELLLEDGEHWSHQPEFGGADESNHIPLIMSGPGIPRGKRIKSISESIDILPTLLDLCGISTNGKMDGKSLLPTMSGAKPDDETSIAITRHGSPIIGGEIKRLFVMGKDATREVSQNQCDIIQPMVDATKKININSIFCGYVATLAWGELHGDWTLSMEKTSEKEVYCTEYAGASEFETTYQNDLIFGKCNIWIEVKADSVFDLSIANGAFHRIETGQTEWEFVQVPGQHIFDDKINLRFRAANHIARIRRVIICNDDGEWGKMVARDMMGDVPIATQENIVDMADELETLGYL
jgi:arylsulfatase A-like enzyme